VSVLSRCDLSTQARVTGDDPQLLGALVRDSQLAVGVDAVLHGSSSFVKVWMGS
jgi:hypothetical protein